MPTELSQLDPAWAWAPYEPSDKCPWNRRTAAHLFRRAGFSAGTSELDEAVNLGPARAVDKLCSPQPASASNSEFDRTVALLAERTAATGNPQQVASLWLYRMLNTPDPLLEKLTLFWHGHFATSAAKVESAKLMLAQNQMLRRCARGQFEEMVRAVSRDPAMLVYLDSTTNRRIRPNENYARELLELFCLGVGNYTEQDIKEVARAFTGWEVRAGKWAFNAIQHDTGTKSFLGRSGNFDGDGAVKAVLEHPASPRFIARKLIRFFMFDEPEAPPALVETIAQELRSNGFETGPVVQRMLGSNLMFSEHAVGRKVRSPVELGVGLLRSLGATTNLVKLHDGLSELGQALLYPPNVKGWDGGRAWINSSSLLGRANLVRRILTANETRYAAGNLEALAEKSGAKDAGQTVDWLLELLAAAPPPAAAREALVRLMNDPDGPRDRSARIARAIHAIAATPEFQLA